MTPTRRRITSRQRQVMRLAADGLTSREIAERLGLSPNTIKAHLTAVYLALGVTNRIEALRALRLT